MADFSTDPTLGGLEIMLLGMRTFVLLAAFAAFAWGFLRMRRESAEQFERLQASQRELAAQTHALSEKVAALATLIAAQPRRAEPLGEPELPVAKPRRQAGVPSYETAKRLARSGASVEEIVKSCGVAGTEARLLRRLHGADSQHDHAA